MLEEVALERLGPTSPNGPGTSTVDGSMLALVELAVLCGLPALAKRAARLALDPRATVADVGDGLDLPPSSRSGW